MAKARLSLLKPSDFTAPVLVSPSNYSAAQKQNDNNSSACVIDTANSCRGDMSPQSHQIVDPLTGIHRIKGHSRILLQVNFLLADMQYSPLQEREFDDLNNTSLPESVEGVLVEEYQVGAQMKCTPELIQELPQTANYMEGHCNIGIWHDFESTDGAPDSGKMKQEWPVCDSPTNTSTLPEVLKKLLLPESKLKLNSRLLKEFEERNEMHQARNSKTVSNYAEPVVSSPEKHCNGRRKEQRKPTADISSSYITLESESLPFKDQKRREDTGESVTSNWKQDHTAADNEIGVRERSPVTVKEVFTRQVASHSKWLLAMTK